jgi:branched-subunit amino acid aminotransferase/4-amino-4-deoxychorismate lyase
MVAFNNIKTPAALLAKQIIARGDIGEPVRFRGTFDQGFYNDPNLPWSWRCSKTLGGSGALGDLGAHTLSVAQFLLGGIREVTASAQTCLRQRPVPQRDAGYASRVAADAEWRECRLKAAFIRTGDPGLKLIETLRRENGVYPMWAGHLARLRRSAEWFGFPLDEQRLCRELGRQPATGVWRIRLTLDSTGGIDIQATAMADAPPSARLAELADIRIDSGDPLRGHKTTERRLYDLALQGLPAESPVFDLVFLNERGEVAEGARSNVFVERDGLLLTPPQASGALPGVLRAELLASGRAREAVLYPADLGGDFWLGNALRGLIPVRLRPA